MRAIYKRELKAYFSSMTGYIFMAFIIFLVGIYFTAYNLTYGLSNFGIVLHASVFAFLIVVPILTMRLLAEERKQKTDQMLITSPLRVTDIILGKYLALLTIFTIPVLLFMSYPLILSKFGEVSFKMAYTAIFGYYLLGAAYLSVGLFISSVTESQVIAAVLGFGILLASYMTEGLTSFISGTAFASFIGFSAVIIIFMLVLYLFTKSLLAAATTGVILEVILTAFYIFNSSIFEGALSRVISIADLAGRYESFVLGIFDITGVVYYLSVIFLFIFLTVQSIEKRRWS